MSGWTSLPILATSLLVLQVNSFAGAVLTIVLGNAILWFIRLGIVSMSAGERWSTLDVSRVYLGEWGKYCVAVLLLVSMFAWYMMQTTTGSMSITQLMRFRENQDIDQFLQVSVFLGIVSTLFCIEGMALLRRLSTVTFPVLVALFFAMFVSLPDRSVVDNGNALSLAGLPLVLATNLGLTADLPTFFRHSRSWATSVKALTVVQLMSIALGLCSLYFGAILSKGVQINQAELVGDGMLRTALIAFIVLSVISANVANVYSASVGWELVAPKALVGRKEYLILGLGLTTIFILVSNLFSAEFLLHVSDSSLVNLSIVLLIGYILARRAKRMPNRRERLSYFMAWALSTAGNVFQLSRFCLEGCSTLLLSVGVVCGVILLSRLGRIRS